MTPLNIDFEQEPAVGAWPVPGVDMTSIQIGACQREYIPVGDSRFPRISLWENVGSDGTACLEVIWDDGLEVRYG